MTDKALLPPDPTRDAWYWIRTKSSSDTNVSFWRHDYGAWLTVMGRWEYPETLFKEGYTLASPHPIPSATQLDALWEWMDALTQAAAEIRDTNPETANAYGIALLGVRAALKGGAP